MELCRGRCTAQKLCSDLPHKYHQDGLGWYRNHKTITAKAAIHIQTAMHHTQVTTIPAECVINQSKRKTSYAKRSRKAKQHTAPDELESHNPMPPNHMDTPHMCYETCTHYKQHNILFQRLPLLACQEGPSKLHQDITPARFPKTDSHAEWVVSGCSSCLSWVYRKAHQHSIQTLPQAPKNRLPCRSTRKGWLAAAAGADIAHCYCSCCR